MTTNLTITGDGALTNAGVLTIESLQGIPISAGGSNLTLSSGATIGGTLTLISVSKSPSLYMAGSLAFATTGTQPELMSLNIGTMSGTLPSSGAYGVINLVVSNDTTNVPAGATLATMALTWNGGFSLSGGHTILNIQAKIDGAVTNAGSAYLIGENLNISATQPIDAGTMGMIAFSPAANVYSGATGYDIVEVIEANVAAAAPIGGGRFGMTMFSGGTYNGQVNQGDAGICIAADTASVGFLTAYAIGRADSPWGVASSGTILGPLIQTNSGANPGPPQEAALGADFGSVNFGTAAFRSPGALIDPSGNIQTGNLGISTSGTVSSINTVGYTGATSSFNNPGASYKALDQLYDTTYNGIMSVDTVNGSGNISTFHWIQPPHSFGATPSTLALIGGSGNQAAVANVTWTQGTTLALQPNGGDVLTGQQSAMSTSATQGFVGLPFCAGTPTGTPTNEALNCLCVVNTSSKNLNFYIPGVGWYHAALTAGAA